MAEQVKSRCFDCGGDRVHLSADPGAWEGYREDPCETCEGTGEMEPMRAAVGLLNLARSYEASVRYHAESAAKDREAHSKVIAALEAACIEAGITPDALDKDNPPETPPF